MNASLVMLAAATLACGGAAAHFYSELGEERGKVAQLESRVAELEQSEPLLEPSLAAPAAPVDEHGSEEAAAPTPAPTVKQGTVATPRNSLVFGAVSGMSPPSAEQQRAMRESMIRERKMLLEDPEYSKAMLMQQRMHLRQQHPDLAAELGISREEADRFLDLLAQQQTEGNALGLAVFDPSDPARQQEFHRKMMEVQNERERQIAEVLGKDGQQRWQDYQQTMGARYRARQLRDSFAAAGEPMTDDQYTQLKTALADSERQRHANAQNFFTSDPATTNPAEAMVAAQERAITYMERESARTRDAVAHLLSSQQMETFQELQESELAMQRAQLRMQRARMEAAQREGREWQGGALAGSDVTNEVVIAPQ